MDGIRDALKKINALKYPLLILAVGVLLLLLPASPAKSEAPSADGESAALRTVLAQTKGVGEVQVILSDKGAVVVCAGADNADVRLDVINAVKTYTGFRSDKITVLKMAEKFYGRAE